MKKLVISLLVVVMALGTMGVAFTQSMNFYGQNAIMSSGSNYIEHVNCTGLYFHHYYHPPFFFGCNAITVKLDKKLAPGTGIFVEVMGRGPGPHRVIATGYLVVEGPCPTATIDHHGGPRGYPYYVALFPPVFGHKITAANQVVVSVIGGEGMHHGPGGPP